MKRPTANATIAPAVTYKPTEARMITTMLMVELLYPA
jgi:hypothetical protein